MFISTNNENTTSTDRPPMDIIWDTFKVYMRGIIISFSVKKKKELDKEIDRVEKLMNCLQNTHKQTKMI